MLRVLIADDHPFYRHGLAKLLTEAGIEVVGEAADAAAAIEAAERLRPDVLVLDLHMPGPSPEEVIRRLAGLAPPISVLVVSASASEPDVSGVILAGASGYLLKDGPVEDIAAGIRAAAGGGSLLSPWITPMVLRKFKEREAGRAHSPTVALSKRELDVLRLVADGKANQEIGEALFIEAGTVRNHVSRLLRKLDVDNRVQAAVRAVREHMV